MSDPWLTIIGLGDDGPDGLPAASLRALAAAEVIFGGPRHLSLVGAGARGRPWPVPFSISPVLAESGRPTVVLASGDPFWFGAGSLLAEALAPGDWRALPGPSSFSLAASRLGWRLETTRCLGLHAAPFARMLREIAPGARLLATLADGNAPHALGAFLAENPTIDTDFTVLEALGGPNERVSPYHPDATYRAPVLAALTIRRGGVSRAVGLPDALFASDGVLTKRPIRALTLSALAPRPGELLVDLGAGSGSVSVEWCLSGGRALAVEQRPDRAALIAENTRRFGLDDRLTLLHQPITPELPALAEADAIFIGGGLTSALIGALCATVKPGARIVANAVTLEAEATLLEARARNGGALLRIGLETDAPLGALTGWQAARTIVQWRWPE